MGSSSFFHKGNMYSIKTDYNSSGVSDVEISKTGSDLKITGICNEGDEYILKHPKTGETIVGFNAMKMVKEILDSIQE